MKERPWITHDGRRIPVRKMGAEHLNNAIRMIQTGGTPWGKKPFDYHKAMLGRLLKEKKKRRFPGNLFAWFKQFRTRGSISLRP